MKLITVAHRVLSLPAATYAGHRTVKATDFLSRERRSILQQNILVIVEEPIKHCVEEKIDCIYKAVCGQRFFAGYSWYVFSLLKLAMNTARVSSLLRSMMKPRRFYNY